MLESCDVSSAVTVIKISYHNYCCTTWQLFGVRLCVANILNNVLLKRIRPTKITLPENSGSGKVCKLCTFFSGDDFINE